MPANVLRRRMWTLGLAAASALLGLSAAPSHAAVIPGINTLQDLINAGSTGVIIGNKTFYNFSFQSSPAGAPTAAQVQVATTDTGNPGLRFTANWTSSGGANEDGVIRYCVHVNDSVPQLKINGVGLDFNPVVTAGSLTNSSVTETVTQLDGTVLGQISTINLGPGATGNRNSANFVVDPAARDLCLVKDISVHSATTGGGTAQITFVDNTFSQIPEPATLGLAAVAALGLIRRR